MWRNTLGNMKVLIACEFSGTVRDEFLKYGHDAVSCDLLPSLSDKGRHIQGDVIDVINGESWDMMIAHPPCTYLTTAGNRHFKDNPERERERERAFEFAMCLYNADIPKICMENPQGYLNTHFRNPDQTIHPWQFGDCVMKRTCLWLKNLPKLYWSIPYPRIPEPMYIQTGGRHKAIHFTEGCSAKGTGLKKWQVRSKTYHGIAHAMAVQWGSEDSQYWISEYEEN